MVPITVDKTWPTSMCKQMCCTQKKRISNNPDFIKTIHNLPSLFHHQELLLAEKWARLNRLPFPPIDTSVFEREGMKELYIFRHPSDPHCPVVFHFVLINDKFRYYKKPGELRIIILITLF